MMRVLGIILLSLWACAGFFTHLFCITILIGGIFSSLFTGEIFKSKARYNQISTPYTFDDLITGSDFDVDTDQRYIANILVNNLVTGYTVQWTE